MRRILLVKTSSLGDVVHCLPAATDIAIHYPGCRIDWVVEETYADIVALHPAVSRVLPVAVRRWRKSLLKRGTASQIASFRAQFDADGYDRIIDVQGLAKSALIARMARGERHGLDRASAREWVAALTYHRVHAVPWTLDAVARNRNLVGSALGYAARGAPDYGIRATRAAFAWLPDGAYGVLLTGTTDAAKLWPEDRWSALGRRLRDAGLACVLPAGTETERRRAERIAVEIGAAGAAAVVAPPLSLKELAQVLAGAALAVGVDTGLTHLAAALGRPTTGVYCGTSPAATGVVGARAGNVGDVARTPGADAVWNLARTLLDAALAEATAGTGERGELALAATPRSAATAGRPSQPAAPRTP
jgi:heptosyltransferase-1